MKSIYGIGPFTISNTGAAYEKVLKFAAGGEYMFGSDMEETMDLGVTQHISGLINVYIS